MTYQRHASRHAHRPPVRPAAAVRSDWSEALRFAGLVCTAAIAAGDGADEATIRQPGQDLSRLMVALRDLAPENFPVRSTALMAIAGAFLHLARFMVQPATGPEARTACARFLAPGVALLDEAFTALRTEEARSWRGQLGEREDG